MRKRSKYKPKPVRPDTVSYVLTGLSLVDEQKHTIDLRIRMHASMQSIVAGDGTEDDVNYLVYAVCMAEAFTKMRAGLGLEFADQIEAGFQALKSLYERGMNNGHRFILTGAEMQAINRMLEVHDVQLSAATIVEMERGIALCNQIVRDRMR